LLTDVCPRLLGVLRVARLLRLHPSSLLPSPPSTRRSLHPWLPFALPLMLVWRLRLLLPMCRPLAPSTRVRLCMLFTVVVGAAEMVMRRSRWLS
jgi:hypothetical protein